MSENRHPIYKTCPHCGANLDPGEQCDCQPDRMHPLPRDGLRATCPYFQQRLDHQGRITIKCASRIPGSLLMRQETLFFPDREARDDAYDRLCCCGGACEIRLRWAADET